MAASVLSPLAPPFHPITGELVRPMIYNDGVPSLTFQGTVHQFLEGIADEVLDEAFSPTAEEAAELEAAEYFVELMANLASLEEKEEAARTLHTGLKKRWHSRRGLTCKPRAPIHSTNHVHRGAACSLKSHDLVRLDHSPPFHVENRMRAKQDILIEPKRNKKLHANLACRTPIQQPRKKS